MLATVVGAVPFVARGQSTTTAPAGKFPPPFANRTWFTFTPPGKTLRGKPATEVVWVVVAEIAPKDPATDVQSPVLSPCVCDRTGAAAMVRKQLLSGCRSEQKSLLGNWIRWNYQRSLMQQQIWLGSSLVLLNETSHLLLFVLSGGSTAQRSARRISADGWNTRIRARTSFMTRRRPLTHCQKWLYSIQVHVFFRFVVTTLAVWSEIWIVLSNCKHKERKKISY